MRLKIIAGNLAVVVLLGLSAFALVRTQLESDLLRRLDSRIAADRDLLDRSFRLAALEFVDLLAQRAGERQMRDVFAGLDLDSRRNRAFEAAESTAAWLADPARGNRGGPDIVVIVDETGKAIARNGARNVMFGVALAPQLPALAAALRDSTPRHDVWVEPQERKLLQTVVAPIRAASGALLGALIVGYDLSNGVAHRQAELIGRDVAFLTEGKVYSASLEGPASRDLKSLAFGPNATVTRAVLAGQLRSSQLWRAALGGDDYSGILARFPMSPSQPVAFAVLGNRSEQLGVASVVQVILILTVLGGVLVVLYGFMIGSAIMRPIEEIEEGVLQVINGRTDLRLETKSAELGGLAFRINQLMNVLTGTEEQTEDEQGRVSLPPSGGGAAWKDAAFDDNAPNAKAAANPDEPIDDPELSARLGAEDEDQYSSRIYREYVAAKQSAGENVANIPQDRFIQRLTGRATALAQKHGCRLVRFQVESQADQVLLRPVLIR